MFVVIIDNYYNSTTKINAIIIIDIQEHITCLPRL